MKPVQKPISNKPTSCNEVSSTCVTWDGPALSFACMNIEICKGDSINVALYELFKMMCVALEKTDISLIDSTCLFDLPSQPDTLEELLNLIIRKLCDQDIRVLSLEDVENRTYSASLPYCLQTIGDTLTVTKLPIDEYFTKVASKICEELDDIDQFEAQIPGLFAETTALLNQINIACAPVQNLDVTPICSAPSVPTPVNIALEALEQAFCSYQNFTGTSADLLAAISYDCPPDINNLPALSNAGTLSQLYGWIDNPISAAQSMNNLWLTICDIRSAIRNQFVGCCSSSPCLAFRVFYSLSVDPSPTPQWINIIFNDGIPIPPSPMPGLNGPRSEVRDYTGAAPAFTGLGPQPAWIATNYPTMGNVFITLDDGTTATTVDTGVDFPTLISFPSNGVYQFLFPAGFDQSSPNKTIKIEFNYTWNNPSPPIPPPQPGFNTCDGCDCCCNVTILNRIYY